jgi:hypothetical protein
MRVRAGQWASRSSLLSLCTHQVRVSVEIDDSEALVPPWRSTARIRRKALSWAISTLLLLHDDARDMKLVKATVCACALPQTSAEMASQTLEDGDGRQRFTVLVGSLDVNLKVRYKYRVLVDTACSSRQVELNGGR